VATSTGTVRVRLAPSTPVATLVQSDRAQITDGSFLGITSVTEPDGSQRAVEVHVFPEAMRGTGEGSYGWDWPGAQGGSKMTNGTASKMTNGTVSRSKMTNGTCVALEDDERDRDLAVRRSIADASVQERHVRRLTNDHDST
jgi:hypothetical protein